MNAQKLITEHIDLWTSSVKVKKAQGRGSSKKRELYGIKKLRELILELAVRGKLVPQNPDHEPAEKLLERIAATKAQLQKDGKIKKQNALPIIEESEVLADLPETWGFARFGTVLDFSGGGQPPKSMFSDEKLEGYVQLIQIRDLGPRPQPVYVPEDLVSKFCTSEDVMIGRYGASVGKVFWGKEGAYNVALIRLHNDYGAYEPRFLFILMNSPLGQNLFSGISRSAQAGFKKGDIECQLLPILSKLEQVLIVSKVDELMILCDQLERKTESSLDAHNLLVDTLLATLSDASNANELSDNWARLAEHFDTLITTDYAVEQLKQTILQLAVQGKLVPQDPTDEPASELLKRIATEKAQLIKDKKIKKQKPLSEITDEEKLFQTPIGWEWVKFGELSDFINGDRGKNYPNKSEYVEKGMPWINTGHIKVDGTLSVHNMNFITKEKFDSLRSGKILEGDLVYCLRGATFGKTAFVSPYENGAIASSLMIIRPHEKRLREYFYIYLISSLGRSQIFRFDNGSAQPNLSANSVKQYSFPCPPLDEQLRIVSKVNELMIYCDQLKSDLINSQTLQVKLTDVLTHYSISL